jgi:hypothetical protein
MGSVTKASTHVNTLCVPVSMCWALRATLKELVEQGFLVSLLPACPLRFVVPPGGYTMVWAETSSPANLNQLTSYC